MAPFKFQTYLKVEEFQLKSIEYQLRNILKAVQVRDVFFGRVETLKTSNQLLG